MAMMAFPGGLSDLECHLHLISHQPPGSPIALLRTHVLELCGVATGRE